MVTGSEASLLGAVFNTRTNPTPGWRKMTEGESDQSGASTYRGDRKMDRASYVPRGRYAMGAPHTDMSAFFLTRDGMDGTDSERINVESAPAVSGLCFIYDSDEKH